MAPCPFFQSFVVLQLPPNCSPPARAPHAVAIGRSPPGRPWLFHGHPQLRSTARSLGPWQRSQRGHYPGRPPGALHASEPSKATASTGQSRTKYEKIRTKCKSLMILIWFKHDSKVIYIKYIHLFYYIMIILYLYNDSNMVITWL